MTEKLFDKKDVKEVEWTNFDEDKPNLKTKSTAISAAPKQDVYEAAEAFDQQQILALERGEVLEGLVYHFKQYNPDTKRRDKDVYGLTIAGVFDVARSYFSHKKLSFESRLVSEEMDDKYARVVVRGTLRDQNGTVVLSLERACRVPRLLAGKFEDVFADRKAQSIAERNILRRMVPEAQVIKTIKEYIKEGKVVYLTPMESYSEVTLTLKKRAKELKGGGKDVPAKK